jgi:hypothetical protein
LRVELHPPRKLEWVVLLCIVVSRGLPAAAQAQIRFTYENPRLQPQKYVLMVQEDGTGSFRSEGGGPSPDDPQNMPVGPLDRAIHISKALRDGMFATARKNKLFAVACEDKEKNIAFQGTKTLQYEGPDGQGSCTYNWSKISQIDKLTEQFEAIALTLEEGSKLQRQYEHGRLSLDAEMEFLEEMVRDGRATEVENIAPILKTLADDDAVLQRVQRRAKALLQGARTD